ncbi:DUF1178 family protein [Roseateles chitosanitabidus]|uniref:DUF1178 family protein n=1 Tax=Roseateles chitosanitabidus TaxID=65048 RepID=UPI00082D256B|nr:DUF1178 family protein [Roseateles chitosanitabidus]MBO9687470.1 DUF1178 family protein [Roseateles chitosanitabidus]
MLVLNLACEAGHSFEGWFGSSSDFDSQQQRGLLSCPLCNSAQVRRMPSAPRLNLRATQGAARSGQSGPASPAGPSGESRAGATSQSPRGDTPRTSPAPLPATAPVDANGELPPLAIELQRQVLQAVRTMIANTEDVGDRFATEARRIHYGETEQRGIRGRATPDEARELADEGIDVVALPVPDALKDPLQ